jgi:hypothetical protein
MCGVGFLFFLVTYKFEVSTIYATKVEQKLKKFVESTTRIGFFFWYLECFNELHRDLLGP